MIKSVLTAICSFVIPGLGQAFLGSWIWAVGLFISALFVGPIINVVAAVHCLFLSAK
jgi:hypothetical protein